MSDKPPSPTDLGQIQHSIGVLTGAVNAMHQGVEAMHQGLTARIGDIRADIQRMEHAHTERMNRMEENFSARLSETEAAIGKRLDSMGTRVTALEAEDKKLIEKTAKLSALGGGIGGALAAAAVELIKRI